jgi:hypothetical protein
MKKTFYCVSSVFRDDGSVKVSMVSRELAEKPENSFRSVYGRDIYADWFGSVEDAEAFIEEARTA